MFGSRTERGFERLMGKSSVMIPVPVWIKLYSRVKPAQILSSHQVRDLALSGMASSWSVKKKAKKLKKEHEKNWAEILEKTSKEALLRESR